MESHVKRQLTLYRKRLIPAECIPLNQDNILYADQDHIITSWNAIRPKKDLHHGVSCYFLKEGFKISKFYQEDNSLLYWYCDIVTYEYNEKDHALTVVDLLADVIIYPNGFVKVVDLDELAIACEKDMITKEQLLRCLNQVNQLLDFIYQGKLQELTSSMDKKDPFITK